MKKFLLDSFLMLLAVLVASMIIGFFGFTLSQYSTHITPQEYSELKWRPDIEPDVPNGKTQTILKYEGDWIGFDFVASSDQDFPYIGYNFNFTDETDSRTFVDLSKYDRITMEVTCNPRNILFLTLFTFDDKATNINNPETFRVNLHYFNCEPEAKQITFNLNDFHTPDWWLQRFGLELIDREYDLEKVISIGIVNSLQTRRDTYSSVKISKLDIVGRSKIILAIMALLISAIWVVFLLRTFKRYTGMLVEVAKTTMEKDLPLRAYQQISISPHKDKTKSELLNYLATEYSNPELNVELVVNTLGINRNKVNEILKDELGLTFTSYINKLRLTESARLLKVYQDESIAQIAYKVGFNNVTYFNKLFKSTYGCSPKQYKDSLQSGAPA